VIPNEVLFRGKEALSDGISSKEKSWFQVIQEWVEDKVTDEELANAPQKYPYCTPVTKEAYYYRRTFCDIFGEKQQKIIPGYWMPKWSSDGKEVKEYVPFYELIIPPMINEQEIMMLSVKVRGTGDFLPKYAGNLDIINCAAIKMLEVL
jgi:hypothetical protein